MSSSFDVNLSKGMVNETDAPGRIKEEIACADAIIIGAGAGLSTSAGFIYSGQRFEHYFFDFIKTYGFPDMYSGGFFDFPTPEMYWAYWSRYIYINSRHEHAAEQRRYTEHFADSAEAEQNSDRNYEPVVVRTFRRYQHFHENSAQRTYNHAHEIHENRRDYIF